MKKIAIGVDIGGGSVKLGLVDSRGRVLSRRLFSTRSVADRKGQFRLLTQNISSLLAEAGKKRLRVAGIGVGAPGPIDVSRGFVYFFPNIPGWKNTPLQALLSRHFRVPVHVDNDANAMAFGEFLFGAGRGAKHVIALTLGTGVGGGLVIGGKLFSGPKFSAAEIGHLIIQENGTKCACGNRGCVEAYVGSGYFTREVQRRLASGEKSILKKWLSKGNKLSPELVARAARGGDAFSKKIWHETGGHLGTALAGLVNILNPEKIILGGGMAQSGDLLLRPVSETIAEKAFPIAARTVRVLRAKLGVDAGLVGAAALVFQGE